MDVRFVKPLNLGTHRRPGEVATFDERTAKTLVQRGYAEHVDPDDAVTEGEEVNAFEDVPHKAALMEAGITSTEEALAADLTEVDGIGPATAEKIRAHLGG